jgi:hypothetical protein
MEWFGQHPPVSSATGRAALNNQVPKSRRSEDFGATVVPCGRPLA